MTAITPGEPVSRSAPPRTELSVRGFVLGALITVLFTAANAYLGLKVGLTFATSIPAAVISMAVLRGFKNVTIQENNIVQTVASAAGTLASIVFVLPGLVMVGWWNGFPFWMGFAICASGGILGVMFSVPLRRALVIDSPLPYPEGVAAAEVLKVGSDSRAGAAEGRAGLAAVILGTLASAGLAILAATKIAAGEIAGFARFGGAATGIGAGVSLALVGIGHLVGLSVGVAILAGIVIAWGIATPILTTLQHTAGPAVQAATSVWHDQVRFIGAGAIAAAALWALVKLAAPVWSGLASAIAASRTRSRGDGGALPRTEQDLPIGIVGLVSLATLVPIAGLTLVFLKGAGLGGLTVTLALSAVVFVAVVGFLVAAVCGYMAGLIGASNSPVSGLGILAVTGAALLLVLVTGGHAGPDQKKALVAFALFVTAIVFSVATISNDNLQDLKTGQLVDATPWKQQAALMFGVLVGSLVIPPLLDLLQHAYGFAGEAHLPHGAAGALAAPQATLLSALARGVIEGKLNWELIGIGVAIGAAVIVIDEGLGAAKRMRLPPLAVALGIYLPVASVSPIVVGAVLGHLYDRWSERTADPEAARRLGTLMASGMIVGDSLFGVTLAAIVVASGKAEPLALVGEGFAKPALWVGAAALIATTAALYIWLMRRARAQVAST